MNYDLQRLYGPDPEYAPSRKETNGCAYWRAPQKYIKAGYAVKSVRLHGDFEQQAAKCRELTREMLEWHQNGEPVVVGTFNELIARYRNDKFSPYQKVQLDTRRGYDDVIKRWKSSIGNVTVESVGFEDANLIIEAMKNNGRSDDYIARHMTQLRMIVGYGKVIQFPGAASLKEVLSFIKVKRPRPSQVAATREQVLAVVAAAEADGHKGFALGLLIQWWTAVRPVEVRGKKVRQPDGSMQWSSGLLWGEHIDVDATRMTKVFSKTEESTGADIDISLALLPDVRERLLSIPREERVGPVIRQSNGRVFDRHQWGKLWARYRTRCDIPAKVKVMHTRAGAISEARAMGVSKDDARDLAGHSNTTTTNIYERRKGDVQERVIQLRQNKT
jgi:integrase